VASSNHPRRQCIGCRTVRSKDELLRFARTQSAAPVFDSGNKLEGRGFYLCPEAKCFRAAYRNKKIRATYFSKQENLEEVIREVQETILKIIKKDIKLCERMGYFDYTRNEEKSIHEDDLVLLWCDSLPEEKVTMHTAACARKPRIFPLQTDHGNHEKGCIVNHKYPMIPRLTINLQKYEMLSSKGPAL
jgi:uncharacterized protein